jgi:hypothetical protein
MSPQSKRARRTKAQVTAAAWDFGGAFGASLQAWNRRHEVPSEPARPPADAAAAPDPPPVLKSRTRGVRQ